MVLKAKTPFPQKVRGQSKHRIPLSARVKSRILSATMLVFGAPGSFSHEAALQYSARHLANQKVQFFHIKNIDNIFREIFGNSPKNKHAHSKNKRTGPKKNSAIFGIIPLLNSQSGFVRATLGSLQNYGFRMESLGHFNPQGLLAGKNLEALPSFQRQNPEVQNWYSLKVHQNLLVLPGTKLKDITAIASHPQALSQCKTYLKQYFPKVKLIETSDTATAAHDLAKGILGPTTAVIASAEAARLYGLRILKRHIEKNKSGQQNMTTFLILQNPQKSAVALRSVGSPEPLGSARNKISLEALNPNNAADKDPVLHQLRQQIDRLDAEIIEMLARRLNIARKIGLLKKNHHTKIFDPAREQALQHLHLDLAKKARLDSVFTRKIFKLIIEEARKVQRKN